MGDDFRYSQNSEWEAQRTNYEMLFDYMNNEPGLAVHAKFGTLTEYFDAIQIPKNNALSLSGDFFTYADRDDHYWSGYYTSRPFHKRLDRVLLTYLRCVCVCLSYCSFFLKNLITPQFRSAEMLHSWSEWDKEAVELQKLLQQSRRALSLFQHHDGITGTARDHVVLDYARQMNDALKACKFVIQQSVYRHLTKSSVRR